MLHLGTKIEHEDNCVVAAAAIAGTKNNSGMVFNTTLFFIGLL
jgi:hypothetical protein